MIKSKRLLYGEEAENAFADYLTKKKIDFIHNKVDFVKVTPKENMLMGDFYIRDFHSQEMDISVDVKRSFKIFEDSIDNFIGNYYILVPDELGIENGWVIPATTIKVYWNKMVKGNSNCIGKKWDDELQRHVRYMNVNNTLKNKITVKKWIKKKCKF